MEDHPFCPMLLNLTPYSDDAEVRFFNTLRDELSKKVAIHYFNNHSEAGQIVLTPHSLKEYKRAGKFQQVIDFNKKILATGKSLITFTGGPDYKGMKGEIVFGASCYHSQPSNIISTPYWLYDLGEKVREIAKPEIPSVGFVGDSDYPGRLNSFISYLPIPHFVKSFFASNFALNRMVGLNGRRVIARWTRKSVIREVRKAKNIRANIIERSGSFWKFSEQERKRIRSEYINNISDNIYHLCIRGDENGSFRLYEVISAGRIPVIIDTKAKLPELGPAGPWSDFGIIVPFQNVRQIGKIITQFHRNTSPEELKIKSEKAKMAFSYLLPHRFIFDQLKQRLK